MTNRINIMNELGEMGSSLSNHTPQNIYEVPHGYFEGFATHVLNRITALESTDAVSEIEALSPLLAGMSKHNPYSVPEDYFKTLEQKMADGIQQHPDYQTADEELYSLSPLLYGLNKETPYALPNGYFDNLATEAINIVGKKTSGKIASLTSRRLYQYAAAAVITGIILLSGFLYLNQQTGNNSSPVEAGKAWSKVEKQVEKISDKELKDFVQLTNTNDLSTQETSNKSIASEDVTNLLKDISDKELQEFLDQTGGSEDETLQMN